jgi:hypothetical protein
MLSSPVVTIGRLPEQGCHEAVMRLIALTFNRFLLFGAQIGGLTFLHGSVSIFPYNTLQ